MLPGVLAGGPPNVLAKSDSGLLDIALDPDFAASRIVYIAFAEGDEKANRTAVWKARYDGKRLTGGRVIFRAKPDKAGDGHPGGRILFLPDKTFLLTIGDGYEYKEAAQDLASHLGKTLRLTREGAAPADNPFAGRQGALLEIWTLGHRNAQGLARDPTTGEIWLHEHGPRGGDEINVTLAGRNYGWPVITYGREYHGPAIGEGTAKAGMEQPLHYWVPSIGPSGMAFHDGNGYPQWKGQLFVGALAAKQLVRLELDAAGRVRAEERIAIGERVRDVRVGPDGALYLLTDEDPGRLLRVVPAD
jgi:glucose/arabinose dehydrogenase